MDIVSYSLAKKYTDEAIAGSGAIKGANCQIQSIVEIDGGHRVTFLWKNSQDVEQTSTMDVMDGQGGTPTWSSVQNKPFSELNAADFTVTNGKLYVNHQDISGKVDKITGKGLSTNDYTDADLAIVQSVASSLDLKADKETTYTKTEVNSLISGINQFSVKIVNVLPTTDIDTHAIYFVPKDTGENDDVYDEYMYVNNAWELIGTTEIDLSQYYTKTEVDSSLSLKLDKVGGTIGNIPVFSTNGSINDSGKAISSIGGRVYTTEIGANYWYATEAGSPYPYAQTAVDMYHHFSSTIPPIWDIQNEDGTIMSKTERDNAALIEQAVFNDDMVTLYASALPTVDLLLRVVEV